MMIIGGTAGAGAAIGALTGGKKGAGIGAGRRRRRSHLRSRDAQESVVGLPEHRFFRRPGRSAAGWTRPCFDHPA